MGDDGSIFQVDILVLGGGMAGLTAGAFAASRGLSVLLVEKAADIGGTALLSGGGVSCPADIEIFKAANPGGNPIFADMLVGEYSRLIDWISGLGVDVTAPADIETMIGIPAFTRGVDIARYIALCRVEIEGTGGFIVTEAHVDALDHESSRVIGALVQHRDGNVRVQADAVILATGGFQGSPEMRLRYLGEGGDTMLLRANPGSVGDGLRLALAAGGTTTPVMDRFYGHTVPAPLHHEYGPADFVRLAMPFLFTRSVTLDRSGQRFVDESAGYYTGGWAVLRQPGSRALLVGDATLREMDQQGNVTNTTLGIEMVDRLEEAKRAGANMFEAETLEALEAAVAPWGYRGVAEGIRAFNAAVEGNRAITPPRGRHRRPFAPPFFAIELQPAISFAFGGLAVDDHARIVRADGSIVVGLYAAGADVGGFYCEQYISGLAMAGVLALRAVDAAIALRSSSPLQEK
jgi:succinate dehydrogenase/fumarate reductase flavoprotein subunit